MSSHDRLGYRKLRLLKVIIEDPLSPIVLTTLRTALALLCQSAGRGQLRERERKGRGWGWWRASTINYFTGLFFIFFWFARPFKIWSWST